MKPVKEDKKEEKNQGHARARPAPAKLSAERLPAESPTWIRRAVTGCSGESYLHAPTPRQRGTAGGTSASKQLRLLAGERRCPADGRDKHAAIQKTCTG